MEVELIKQENKRLREKMYYFSGYTHTHTEKGGSGIVVVFSNAKKEVVKQRFLR